MKHLVLLIPALLFGATLMTDASAGDLEGHMEYTITSYTLDDNLLTGLEEAAGGNLLITGSSSDILTDGMKNQEDYGEGDFKPAADVLSLSAEFIATPDLALQGTIGVARNTEKFILDQENTSSWEANVGIIYKLFNTINYEVHFGYMETGDLFKEKSSYSDVENIIMISNKLSMSF
ncbi:MAG: hypothetical protein ABR512_06375 [Desulfopila sp.]